VYFSVNSALFCKSFSFNTFSFVQYKYTDNNRGTRTNYLAYLIKGHARFRIENETVTMTKGDILFIPEGCRYRSYWYGDPKIEFISLGFRCLPNFQNLNYPLQILPRDEKAAEVMREIAAHKSLDAAVIGRFYTLVGELLPRMSHRAVTSQRALVDKATGFLLTDPQISVGELAMRCAVSESALYAAFKRESDKSILEVRKEIVLTRARELLTSTNDSVEEISRRLGFSSGAYFRKCFKKQFGASPREIRRHSEI
jgi:AraC-like DNA-binding protein